MIFSLSHFCFHLFTHSFDTVLLYPSLWSCQLICASSQTAWSLHISPRPVHFLNGPFPLIRAMGAANMAKRWVLVSALITWPLKALHSDLHSPSTLTTGRPCQTPYSVWWEGSSYCPWQWGLMQLCLGTNTLPLPWKPIWYLWPSLYTHSVTTWQ